MGSHKSFRFLFRPDPDVLGMLKTYMVRSGINRTNAANMAMRIGLATITSLSAVNDGAAEKKIDTDRKKD